MSGKFTISKVWGERFHRRSSKDNSPTKDWIFYISRPTLERLRKPDKNGSSVRLLRKLVKEFLAKDENNSSAEFDGLFSIETRPHEEGQYSTFCYPFDINDEIDNKLGVLIHLGHENVDNVLQKSVTFEEFGSYPTMFDKTIEETIAKKLGDGTNNHPNPPGVTNSDPMWMEFSSSKILPTDQLIHGEEEEFNHGPFRSIISHQYIEVRLVRSRILGKNASHYNREQLDAISAYESLNSGFSNFAGPPGTGKSTILHMVCAHHIFLNFIKGEELRDKEKRILYYVPSPVLKEEARREVKSILENIYKPSIEALGEPTEALTDLSFIEFVSQEDLFIITGHTKLDSEFNILREASNEKLAQQLQMKGSESDIQKNINSVKKGLRNVQFGLLGGKEPRRFADLETHGKGIDLFKPILENGIGKFSPNHLLSLEKFITNVKESDASKKTLKKLTVAIERLRSDNKLYNGQDYQFWDPAVVIQQSLDVEHSEKSIWGKLENSIDFIVIDEVQDISITEIRILLTHFASRAEGQELRPFRLVCAGDENQNVNHLLFTEQNKHVRFLYTDWVLSLQNSIEKSIEGYKLSHNLGPSSEKNLVSGYRVFNEMIPYVNKVLQRLREFHAPHKTQSEKTRISKSELKETPFGRKGVCITLGNKIKDKDKNLVKKCQSLIIEQLRKQLGLDEDNQLEAKERSVPIRIAFTYDKDDYENKFNEGTNPFHNRLVENGVPINDFAADLNSLFSIYTKAFDNDDELRDSLRLKGIMDVSSIKGLTMPITLVLPSRSLMKGVGKESEEDLSLYLVQITRAQYMNIILEDTRKFDFPALMSGINQKNIDSWLQDILLNSAGFDFSLSSLFERTLEEYTSETLWNRLEGESKLLEKDLFTYIQWLRTIFELIIDQYGHLTGEVLKEEFFGPNQSTIIVEGKETEITKIKTLLQTYLLGEYLNKQNIAALKLFLTINCWLRQGDYNKISDNDMKNEFQNWIAEIKTDENSFLDYDDELTLSWLELICNRDIEAIDNKVCNDLNAVFDKSYTAEVRRILPEIEKVVRSHHNKKKKDFISHLSKLKQDLHNRNNNHEINQDTLLRAIEIIVDIEKKSSDELRQISNKNGYFELEAYIEWPVTPLPRLLMGPWRIKKPPKIDDSRREDINPWMDEGSQFFNIHPNVLDHALIRGNDKLRSFAKIKLFLGMISQRSDIFTDGMREVLDSDDQSFRHKILNWYVDVFKERETHQSFKKKVSEKLELLIKQIESNHQSVGKFQDRLTKFLETAASIERFEQMVKAFDFDDWDKCAVVRNLFQQTIELTHDYVTNYTFGKQAPKNPFKKGNNIYRFFERHFSEEDDSDEHKRWFDLLWGVEQLLVETNVFINSGEFDRHKLIFPSFKTEFGKKINRCVNAFADVGSKSPGREISQNIYHIFTRLESALKPEEDKNKAFVRHTWIENLLEMLRSMNIAYEDDVENQLQNEPNINGWETDNILDLQNRFSNQLFEVCKESLPIVMLSFALNMNQTGIDIDTIMSQSQLQEYLKSPQARFVYACLTAEYVSADDALSAWKELKGFLSKENGDYRPLLYDTLHQQHIQRERRYLSNDGEIVSIPVRHDCMLSLRSRPRHQYRLEPHFVNAATFRGLVSLSEGDLKAASAYFRESGLLQYSAALELCMLYNDKDMEVKDLISLFAKLLKQEYNTFIDTLYTKLPIDNHSMYDDLEDNHTMYDDNRHFMFGIGPEKTSWTPKERIRYSLILKLDFKLPSFKLDRSKNEKEIDFLIHSTRMEQYEKLRTYLEWLKDETRRQSNYGERWSEKINMHKDEFKMFFDYTNRNDYPYFEFKWADKKSKNQHKPGFAPPVNNWHKDLRLLNRVNHFLQPFFDAAAKKELVNLNQIMNQSDWNEHVQRLTGVNGAILGYMLPDRVKLPEPVDLAELKQKHEQFSSWFLQNVSKDMLVIANGELKYYVDKIGAEIKKKNFEVALDVIVYELNRFISDGKFVGFVDVHNELLQRVIENYKLLNKEKWNQSHFNPKNSQDLKYKVHSSVKEILDKSNS